MGLIKNIRNYFTDKRINKLEKDLLLLRDKTLFDPRFLPRELSIDPTERFSRRVSEYKVWSMGNPRMLRYFYNVGKSDSTSYVSLNYFWHKARNHTRMLHCGVPGLISTVMADVLFGGGVDTNVVIYAGEGDSLKVDERVSRKANEYLDNLKNLMFFSDRISTAATNESWGGHCFLKLTHDVDVSDYPILETADLTEAEVIKVRGLTKAIIFKSWYQHKSSNYRLDEIYSTNKEGDATIQYRLFKLEGGKEVEVELLSIPQTFKLFNIDGIGSGGFILVRDGLGGIFTYNGLKGMLAFEKPNKTPSLEFPNSPYGASDYEGAIDSFDALDEVYSGNIEEIRRNKTIRYIPTTMIKYDEDGESIPDDGFEGDYVKVKASIDQNAKNQINIQQIDDKTESFLSKWRTALTTVCNKAKISPYSIGVTWLESINPSAESQQERNKVTQDMRKAKLELWKPLLEELLIRALQLTEWMRKNAGAKQDAFADIKYDWNKTSVQVSFGQYIEDTEQARINTWGGAKQMGVASPETAIEKIHPDWTKKQIQDEVNLIRFYEGVSADNPDNLLGLNGREGDDE